ncbi:MAG TPA: IS701 family transposase [Polyangiales bacterium]
MHARFEAEAIEQWHAYLDGVGSTLRDKRQRASFALYALGLLSDGERKSLEPIAARACGDPARTHAVHEQLIHFLGASPWKDQPVRLYAANHAVDAMQTQGPIRTWVIDDTGFLKQGEHSPGVQRQYTGSAGKTTNCQIGVSLVLATEHAHVATDFRLYLPESWIADRERCRRAHIPDDIDYEPKWALALSMIEAALRAKLPKGVVLADADYGTKTVFRDMLHQLGLSYAVGVQGTGKLRVMDASGTLSERMTIEQAGRSLQPKLRAVTWREGTRKTLRSRFARVRVVVDRDDGHPRDPEWLLVEWPKGESAPTKFVLSTLPANISCKQLVRTVKSRWRIERSYEDLKGELGLDHYEGRSFVGWHHHVSVVLACYAFLVAQHVRSFPPSARRKARHRSLAHAA